MKYKVSLITPCYNGALYLQDYLNSLEQQNVEYLEFIFVDDGSEDETEVIFNKWQQNLKNSKWTVKYLQIDHQGQAAAISRGLKESQGDYLMWADADDVLLPEAISKKANFLQLHPNFRIVRNNAVFCNELLQSMNQFAICPECPEGDNLFEALFLGKTSCLAGTYMMTMELFKESYPKMQIPYSPEGQNLQLLLPPLSRSRCGYLDEVLLLYRTHEDSHAHKKRSFREQMTRIEGFYQLLISLIPYCDAEDQHCRWLAEQYKKQETDRLIKMVAERGQREYRNRHIQ